MISPLFEQRFTVNEDPQDYIRHVNNLRYLEWFIEAAISHAELLGWGMQACKEIGLAWVAKSHNIEYMAPAYQNDILTIQTWIQKVTPTRITRCYECKRGDKLLAKAYTVWVLVDYEGERARPIPKKIKELFEKLLR